MTLELTQTCRLMAPGLTSMSAVSLVVRVAHQWQLLLLLPSSIWYIVLATLAERFIANISANQINEERIAAGKSPVGFVNPTFYANPGAFNDVVVGSNQGCGLTNAFYCAPGWDPPSGLGTPNYQKLKNIFMAMQ